MTVIALTTTGIGTWTVPNDWNNAVNSIECIGAGAGGAGINQPTAIAQAIGGAGGAWAKKSNVSLTIGASIPIFVGAGGAAASIPGGGSGAVLYGAPGQATRFFDVVSTTTMQTPSTNSQTTNNTYLDLSASLPAGLTITGMGFYSTVAMTFVPKIMWVNTANTQFFQVNAADSFSHGGGGWQDFTLSVPITVPIPYPAGQQALGLYYVGVYWNGNVVGQPAAVSSIAFIAGNNTGGSGWTATSNWMLPIRYTGYKMASCLVGAQGGGAGRAAWSASNPASVGGDAASSVGTLKNSGGNGGGYTKTGPDPPLGTGGGGAGGPNGAGNHGIDTTSADTVGSAGGSGDGGSGGAGGAKGDPATAGSPGTEYTTNPGGVTFGSGGGGGGCGTGVGAGAHSAGDAGSYGAGGGGCSVSAAATGTSGAGKQGVIIITYTPLILAVQRRTFPAIGTRVGSRQKIMG